MSFHKIKLKLYEYVNNSIRILKGLLPIRIISFPYENFCLKKAHIDYHASGEPQRIRELKNQYVGKWCFIIGNGATLRVEDIDLIKEEVTIASNRIYKIFQRTSWRPTIYMAEDPDGLSEMIPNLSGYYIQKIIIPFSTKKWTRDMKNVLYGFWSNGKFIINRYNDMRSHISEDVHDHFSCGYTVTFSAIQLAIYMGIKEIYLLGVDFDYAWVSDRYGRKKRVKGVQTYFDGKERKGSYLNYYSTMYAYSQAKKYADEHNIKIYNATRGGKLEVFPRVDFDSLFPADQQ